MQIFQEHVLNSPACCNNCFRRVRTERTQRESTDPKSVTSARLSPYTRDEHTTKIDTTPFGTPAQATAVWCACGVESAFERIWDDGDDRCLTMARFKTLLRRCIETLEAKEVTLSRRPTVRIAIQHYRDNHDVNDALGAGVKAGVQHSAATTGRSKTAALSD